MPVTTSRSSYPVGLVPALHLRGDVRADFVADQVTFTSPLSTLRLRPVSSGLERVLRTLVHGPAAREEVLDLIATTERAHLEQVLHRAGHLFAASLLADGRELVQIEQTVRGATYGPAVLTADSRVRLSKFAYCRSQRDGLVLESPQALCRFRLVDRAARELVAALGRASELSELEVDGLSPTQLHELAGHLVGAGLAELAAPDGGFASDTDPVLRQWDFHDLLFHARTRSGRYDDALGAVFPYREEIEPVPALKPLPAGPCTGLTRPTLEKLLERDPPLTAVLEARTSVRSYGSEPMTLDQLAEFLYRVGRARAVYRSPGAEQVVSRPYPSGGGLYELELYVTVDRCARLGAGIYYYDGAAHQLVLVNDSSEDRQSMLAVAALATGLQTAPDVLITCTSRFQRLAWKYRSIAYATTLRNTGVLYQTMYLVATAMGLAPCGLGNGSADLSARVLGLDYEEESSVGDFLLGSRPDEARGWSEPDEHWQLLNSADWPLRAGRLLP